MTDAAPTSAHGPATGPGAPARRDRRPDGAFIWSLTLREALFLAFIAALMFVGRMFLRVPIHWPGHTGIVWIAFLVIGRGIVDKRGAGLLMGIVAGVLVTLFAPGESGLLAWTKYAAAGITLDLVVMVLGSDLETIWKAVLAGACAHLAKMAAGVLIDALYGLPWALLLVRDTAAHIGFGAIGGLLGALVLRALRKVPMFARTA